MECTLYETSSLWVWNVQVYCGNLCLGRNANCIFFVHELQNGQVSLKAHVLLPSHASTLLPTLRCVLLIMNFRKSQDKYRFIPLSELAQHNTADSAWLAIKRRNHPDWEVWDFTTFLGLHPGGSESTSSHLFLPFALSDLQ
jgi:hypothetical protein